MVYYKVNEVIKKWINIGLLTKEVKKKVLRHVFTESFFVKGLS